MVDSGYGWVDPYNPDLRIPLESITDRLLREDLRKWSYDAASHTFEIRERWLMTPKPVNAWWQADKGCMTVEFADGRKVTATAEAPEGASPVAGFAIAVCKYIFGSATVLENNMNNALENPKAEYKARQRRKEQEKRTRELMATRKKRDRERKIREEMEQLRIKAEAERRFREKGGDI